MCMGSARAKHPYDQQCSPSFTAQRCMKLPFAHSSKRVAWKRGRCTPSALALMCLIQRNRVTSPAGTLKTNPQSMFFTGTNNSQRMCPEASDRANI